MINSSLLSGIGLLVMALVALFFKNKADKATADAQISKIAAQDAPLSAQQTNDEAKIKVIDAGIQKMKDDQLKMQESLKNQTDQDRADSWNTGKN